MQTQAHSERRVYPRIHLFRSLSLEDERGARVKANLRDLCPGGLQAMCDRESAHTLLAETETAGGLEAARFTARFQLPVSSDFAPVEIECQIVHRSEIPEEGVALGLSFLLFHGDSLHTLGRYIVESMQPPRAAAQGC